MANFCLMPAATERFKQKLIDGTINPEKLTSMTSEERHAFFSKIVGEDAAKGVNASFESKLLLKNQKQGYITWARKTAGLSEPARRDIISRIQRLDHVLDPAEEKMFLKDLAETKLGFGVSQEEAKNIATLAKNIGDLETKTSTKEQSLQKGWTLSKDDVDWGRAKYDLQKYLSDLKNREARVHLSDLKGKGVFGATAHGLHLVADISKSIGASLDDSFALRQGIKAFWTNHSEWRRQFLQSFVNIVKAFKNTEAANREFHARLMGDPMYDDAVKNGLALTRNEDVFPTSLPEKIPLAGRAFGASEVAYNAFAQNLRLNIYKQQMRLAEGLGEELPKDYAKNMAKMVNSLTGRGGFGKAEPLAGSLNVAFYSLRFLKSNVDTLFLHPLGIGVKGAAQKQAAKNLAKIVAGTAAVLGTANALKPGSVDFDPRSANFGKIKIGNTRFDVTGSMGSIVSLASQFATWSTKNPTTGAVKNFGGGFGQETAFDNFLNFLTNKTSPVGSVAVDYAKGRDHSGNKPTIGTELGQLGTPLGVKNYIQSRQDDKSANLLAVVIADGLGISANTYGQSNQDWNKLPDPSASIKGFQQYVSASDFKKANAEYNQKVTTFDAITTAKPEYKSLPNDRKATFLTTAHEKIQKDVMKKYGYTYKRTQPSSQVKSTEKALLENAK